RRSNRLLILPRAPDQPPIAGRAKEETSPQPAQPRPSMPQRQPCASGRPSSRRAISPQASVAPTNVAFFVSSPFAVAMTKHEKPVERRNRELLFLAIRPNYVQTLDLGDCAQADMDSRILAGEVPISRLNQPPPTPPAAFQSHLRPIRIPSAARRL